MPTLQELKPSVDRGNTAVYDKVALLQVGGSIEVFLWEGDYRVEFQIGEADEWNCGDSFDRVLQVVGPLWAESDGWTLRKRGGETDLVQHKRKDH